ncbi:hypothetical protein RhiirC2_735807 [Rhizophagus irregularis]|uniref:Uncharacterized protein n=1 Tax=Rhizophagus irregularis TaxID=588596 RepID=A0A2N1NPI8_9GLOM|nr:hypothetical protein RhiirC2_735807 [Rhizophagus irregularis]
MSSKSTVTDPQTQTPTKNIILSYSSNFTPTINNTTSLRNAHRNVMAHTRNSSSPASYFNSNSTSHRRVYSAKSILRESYSGNSKSLKSKESNNIKNNDEEIHRLINSDSATIEKSNEFPESSYAAANSSDVYSQTENINRRSSISLSSSSSIQQFNIFLHLYKLSRILLLQYLFQ